MHTIWRNPKSSFQEMEKNFYFYFSSRLVARALIALVIRKVNLEMNWWSAACWGQGYCMNVAVEFRQEWKIDRKSKKANGKRKEISLELLRFDFFFGFITYAWRISWSRTRTHVVAHTLTWHGESVFSTFFLSFVSFFVSYKSIVAKKVPPIESNDNNFNHFISSAPFGFSQMQSLNDRNEIGEAKTPLSAKLHSKQKKKQNERIGIVWCVRWRVLCSRHFRHCAQTIVQVFIGKCASDPLTATDNARARREQKNKNERRSERMRDKPSRTQMQSKPNNKTKRNRNKKWKKNGNATREFNFNFYFGVARACNDEKDEETKVNFVRRFKLTQNAKH